MQEKKTTLRALTLQALFVALIIVGTFIRLPIPYIPITLQSMVVIMAGLMLGPRRGSLAVTAYVLLGLVGLPVFSKGGGLAYVVQPTFGYILGFIAAAALAAWLSRPTKLGLALSQPASFARLLGASLAALVLLYVIGVAYFYLISAFYLGQHLSLWTIVLHGFLLVLPGDVITCILGVILTRKLWPKVAAYWR